MADVISFLLNKTSQNSTSLEDVFVDKYLTLAEYSEHLVADDEALFALSSMLMWIVAVLGFVANTFLLALIIYHRKTTLGTFSNVIILGLSVVDITSLVIMSGSEAYMAIIGCHTGNDNSFILAVSVTSTAAAIFASLMITSLAIQKFVAVFFPFKVGIWLKKQTAVIFIAVSLAVSIVAVIPMCVLPRHMRIVKMENHTDRVGVITDATYMGYSTMVGTLALALAAFVMLSTYSLIIFQLCRQKIGKRRKYQDAIKHLFTILVVVVFYLIFALSVNLTWYVLAQLVAKPPVSSAVDNLIRYCIFLSIPVSILHIALNPILHALTTENYSKLFPTRSCKPRSN